MMLRELQWRILTKDTDRIAKPRADQSSTTYLDKYSTSVSSSVKWNHKRINFIGELGEPYEELNRVWNVVSAQSIEMTVMMLLYQWMLWRLFL